MTLAETTVAVMWLGLTAYAVFAGADFGGGVWDLAAGGSSRSSAQRALIEHTIGPIWEANHVWLIFVLVVLWTGFPSVFAAVASTLYIPLTAAALGIILRGSGFAFRKAVEETHLKRLFGAAFALSSILTPFFLGTVAGAVASGRVPLGNATGDSISSWLNPTSVFAGGLAVIVCAYLASVYLTGDARRAGQPEVEASFRNRALFSAVVAGAIAMGGIAVLAADAPALFHGLTGRAAPLVGISAAAGLASIAFVWKRSYSIARIAAAVAVTAVIWGWGFAQYPYMLQGEITIRQAAAGNATLTAMLWSLGIGAILFVPGLILLLVMFQKEQKSSPSAT